jgi:hypothetical protein
VTGTHGYRVCSTEAMQEAFEIGAFQFDRIACFAAIGKLSL